MNCYQCGCSCNNGDTEFDIVIKSELQLPITLKDIIHSNIAWYVDKEHVHSHMMNEWFKEHEEGIYFLWYKDEYCAKHNLFHFTSLYVGKGIIAKRVAKHWLEKEFGTDGIVYITYFKCKNRIAKYIEQLTLDVYDIPFNKNEKCGKKKLCGYYTQFEVD